jgi:folate-binding protein YgfZ
LVFAEDVNVRDVTDRLDVIAVVGPSAAEALGQRLDSPAAAVSALGEHGSMRAQIGRNAAIVTRTDDLGDIGFEVYSDRETSSELSTALREGGVLELDPDTADVVRLERGVPVFGRDMNEETIPLEAGIEARAISFTKGCYVGQEVIVRVLHRGHGRIVRSLVGLTLEGTGVPAANSTVHAGNRNVGRITSSAFSPALRKPIALAYVHRDYVAPGTSLVVDGRAATVSELPFVRQ